MGFLCARRWTPGLGIYAACLRSDLNPTDCGIVELRKVVALVFFGAAGRLKPRRELETFLPRSDPCTRLPYRCMRKQRSTGFESSWWVLDNTIYCERNKKQFGSTCGSLTFRLSWPDPWFQMSSCYSTLFSCVETILLGKQKAKKSEQRKIFLTVLGRIKIVFFHVKTNGFIPAWYLLYQLQYIQYSHILTHTQAICHIVFWGG